MSQFSSSVIERIATLDVLDEVFGLQGKKILVRVDFNSPIDPNSQRILSDSRIRAHVPTLRELIERGASVVLMSHQGRPGDPDFTTLEEHAKLLEKHLGVSVIFVEDVIGPYARSVIEKLKPGEIVLLDNVRLVSEEIIEASPEKQSKTIMVKRLAPLFNLYVNDAFATAHRSQPSIVGFPMVLPSGMGRLFEKELKAISHVLDPNERPRVFVLGGAKVHDTLRIIEYLHSTRSADRILLAGLVALVFMAAKGLDIGDANRRLLESKGLMSLIPRARRLLLRGAPIETPIDFVVEHDGDVRVEHVGALRGVVRDLGPATVSMYSELIREASVIVLRGPAGVIEDARFRRGSQELLRAALSSKGFVVIGGGHLTALIDEEMLSHSRLHVSTAGGALLLLLAGEKLPAIEALLVSAEKYIWPRRGKA